MFLCFGTYCIRSLSNGVIDAFHAGCIEAAGTGFVVFVIFMVTSPTYAVPGVAVPGIVALVIGAMTFALGPLTG